MRALHHVDGVELDAAGVLGEPRQARRGEAAGTRPVEVLALQEERRHRAARDDGDAHR
jgi:hypothetical protein